MDLETFLVSLYVVVDEWWKRHHTGVVAAFGLAPANCDERKVGEFLIFSDGHDAYLADRGSSSVVWERHWLDEHGALVAATPQKNAKRAWPEADRKSS